MLKGKRILVGVSGGIAAYKIPGLIRLLIKAGAEVKTIMTKDAENFVTKQTLSVVSKNKVEEEFFDQNGTWNNHVELGLWPDLILIAPATANTIGKMAHGMCDNLLIATYLSSRCPVMIAPAMDEDMYLHFSTDSNLKILSEKGHIIIEPESGELASGLTGKGRLNEPDEIFKFILDFLNPVFSGKKILINAGPTYEAIDPVRFIGNRSSGKTGIYLAEVFSLMGANVTLVLGPTEQNVNANKFKVTRVETAIEMLNACMEEFFDADIFIGSAAVSDYRIENPQNKKIKKEEGIDSVELKLVKNPDILFEAGKRKKENQLLIGFALETDNGIENAKKKILNKNLDLIILNSPNEDGQGFKFETNKITLINKNNKIIKFELMHKKKMALEIAQYVHSHLM